MKKLFAPIAALAAMALLFTACAAKDTPVGASQPDAAAEAASESTVEAEAVRKNAPPPGEQPQERPNADVKVVYGEITEVIGNSLTLKLIERPQRMIAPGGQLPDGEAPARRGEGSEGEDGFTMRFNADGEATPPQRGEGDSSARLAPGGEGADGQTRRNVTRNDDGTITMTMPDGTEQTFDPANPPEGMTFGGRGQAMERQYTGEEIEVIIPVGVPVMTRSMGENGVEEKEVAMNKLKSGDTITITYKEDGKTIDTAYVQQAGAAGNGGGMFFGAPGGEFGGGQGVLRFSNDGGQTFTQQIVPLQ